MMISLVLVSLGRRWLQEYLRAGAGPTLETEASSFRKESPSPEARATSSRTFTKVLHLDGVADFKSLSCTHRLLCQKQSRVLGKAGLRVVFIIQVRTARLRGRYPRPQHQREAESEPLT